MGVFVSGQGQGENTKPPTGSANSSSAVEYAALQAGAVVDPTANYGSVDFTNMGALSSDTYADLLNITGSGVLTLAGAFIQDGTNVTGNTFVRVTIDGTVVHQIFTSDSGDRDMIAPVGFLNASGEPLFESLPFTKSCQVEIKNSVGCSTGDIYGFTRYRLT